MNSVTSIMCRVLFCLIALAGLSSQAETVTYLLDDLILADGGQITGSFDWSYSVDDFEGGMGEFNSLSIPYTIYSLADGNLETDIQTDSIEMTGNGNYHDVGLDVTLKLAEPFTPTQPASIDLNLSFFECCGNGFRDQFFASGRIVPFETPGAICDLDGDHSCGGNDLDQLYDVISSAVYDARFDLSGDGVVDNEDIPAWLAAAGTENGKTYLAGDANLDGDVGGADFSILAANFGATGLPAAYWGNGNFDGANTSGVWETGGSDLTLLASRFGHVSVSAVPEANSVGLLLLGVFCSIIAFRSESSVEGDPSSGDDGSHSPPPPKETGTCLAIHS